MNQTITNTVKNRFSESHFRKLGFDEDEDRLYYYDNYPIKKLPITSDDRATYIIKYYYCRKNDSRAAYELKKLQLDMYADKYQIVGYEKLKSEEKELFSNMVSDEYLNRLLTLDTVQELKMHKLKQATGFE